MTQMDEPMKAGGRLEVSVSFGRFENDALSWEKWSSFSPNKYLEEAGSLSTPGSVAQKKAYFEAHYKKIAARKAELEQEKMMESVLPTPSAVSCNNNCIAESLESDNESGLSSDEGAIEEVANESCSTVLANGPVFDEAEYDGSESPEGDEEVAHMNGSIIATLKEKNVDAAAVKCESFTIEEAKNELNGNGEGPQLNFKKDDMLVEPVTPEKHLHKTVEKPLGRKSGIEQSNALRKGTSNLNARNAAQKVTPSKKERPLAGTKNKIVSPLVKPLQTSTPRNSKKASMNTTVSVPKTVKKQVNGSPLLKSKNDLVGQSKKSAPTSLHMSLSLSSANSMSAVSMTRKSLIMEKMGDKDIVKRAFKAFQNRPNGSFLGEKPSPVKHVSPTAFEPKISAPRSLTKGNEGPRKDSVNQATQRSQSGSRSNPLPKGLHKSSAMDRRNLLAFSPTIALRSDEKAEKRKEFLKKLEANSIARGVEKAQLSAKSKGHIGNEIHPQRPTLSR